MRLLAFFKREAVLTVAALCALATMVLVPPDAAYLGYIDLRVLCLLLCLMAVVAGFQSCGAFQWLAGHLLSRGTGPRALAVILVLLPFFCSMAVTNDVALITFAPFALLLLDQMDCRAAAVPLLVLQTIAANLGSMATPIGNPQNLYLYSSYSLSAEKLVGYMLPLTVFSALLLVIAILFIKNHPLSVKPSFLEEASRPEMSSLIFYLILFLVCLGCVMRIYPWPVMLIVILLAVLFKDRTLFQRVDYFLLLTFVCFFIFIGNMERLPAVSSLLTKLIAGREFAVGVLLSQCISNVPAAILLSGFTDAVRPLLYGVNIGGLGTLIASLASVISYRAYAEVPEAKSGTYMVVFTAYNLVFLAVLCIAGWALMAQ